MLCFISLLRHRPVRYKFPTGHGTGAGPLRVRCCVRTGTDARGLHPEPRAVPRRGPGSCTARSVRPELSLPAVTPLSTYLHAHAKLYKQQ